MLKKYKFIAADVMNLKEPARECLQVGFVDICNKPYDEFIKHVKLANQDIYKVVAGLKEKCDEAVEEVDIGSFFIG